MPFCTKWHSCDSLFFVQFTAQLIAYRLPAFFVLLHKCHVLRGYINITVVAFFCGCVLIAEVPKNQKALVDMNGILPSALVHRPPKVITPTSRHAPRARLRQDKPPRAHIECAPTDCAAKRVIGGYRPLHRRGGFHIRPRGFPPPHTATAARGLAALHTAL